MAAIPLEQEIEYPTSDGEPMAETPLHGLVMTAEARVDKARAARQAAEARAAEESKARRALEAELNRLRRKLSET